MFQSVLVAILILVSSFWSAFSSERKKKTHTHKANYNYVESFACLNFVLTSYDVNRN